MKICSKCKQEKPLTEFYQFKSGINKGYYCSYCKQCRKEYKKQYYRLVPWAKTHKNILSRCNYRYHYYYKKGIKNFLTTKDLKFLWFRDKAYLMKQPSIDRLNTKKDYTLENCQYIEYRKNCRQGGLKTKEEYRKD